MCIWRPDIFITAATVVFVKFLVSGRTGPEAAEAVAKHGAESLHACLAALIVLVFSSQFVDGDVLTSAIDF